MTYRLNRTERMQTAVALNLSVPRRREYVESDIAPCVARERQLIAEAEREAARIDTERKIRATEEWGAYRAAVRARLK